MSGLSGEDRARVQEAARNLKAKWDQSLDDPGAEEWLQQGEAITRALALIDQQEKALEAADRLAELAEDDAVSRAIVDTSARAYRSARSTSTKEDG